MCIFPHISVFWTCAYRSFPRTAYDTSQNRGPPASPRVNALKHLSRLIRPSLGSSNRAGVRMMELGTRRWRGTVDGLELVLEPITPSFSKSRMARRRPRDSRNPFWEQTLPIVKDETLSRSTPFTGSGGDPTPSRPGGGAKAISVDRSRPIELDASSRGGAVPLPFTAGEGSFRLFSGAGVGLDGRTVGFKSDCAVLTCGTGVGGLRGVLWAPLRVSRVVCRGVCRVSRVVCRRGLVVLPSWSETRLGFSGIW